MVEKRVEVANGGLEAEAPWPSRRAAWYAVAILLVASMFSVADRTILSLLIDPIRSSLAISDTEVSLLLGFAFSIFYSSMALPCAFIADRWNRRRLIVIAMTFWSTMTVLSALAQDFGHLFLARMGLGIGEAALLPAAYSILADLFPKHQLGRAMAVFSIGGPIGGGVALIFGGLIISAVNTLPPVDVPLFGPLEGWRLTFIGIGAPGLLVALWLQLTLREPRRRAVTQPAFTGLGGVSEVFSLVRNQWRAFLPLFLGLSTMSVVLYGFITWTPTLIERGYGVPTSQSSLAFGVVFAVFASLGLVLGGSTVDELVRRRQSHAHVKVLSFSVALSAIPCVLAPFMPSMIGYLILLAAIFILGMMHGAVLPAALQLMAPNHLRAQISAFYYVFQILIGLGIGPTLIAVIAEHVITGPRALGYSVALLAGVLLPIAATGVFLARKHVERAMRSALAPLGTASPSLPSVGNSPVGQQP